MTTKLQSVLDRFDKLNELISDPQIISDIASYRKYTKELSDITETVEKIKELQKIESERADAELLISGETDSEMKELLSQEIKELIKKQQEVNNELKLLLIPKDENDDKSVIVEIRAGAGGEEAALFAYELYRMYVNFSDKHRYKSEEIDGNFTELGGVKEVTFSVSGNGVYGKLKFESGVHRVQRVPETESQGRIQTSTATVAVLPEAEDVEVKIDEKDLKIDTYRSSGAGGQHVNKTESCIRMTHIPTGIVVTCQDERSQIKNREKAMKVMKSRLYDYYNSQYRKEYDENRKSQIGTGDRSERIRTYNFPQGRITDHRIGFTLYSLEDFLSGNIDEMIEALQIADREAKLANVEDN
ncbi:MAG: peptide chain release factor 1 [Clostridiales bacterium]|nr:peptide chain release factor 1 [Clostridiales bacterium]